MVHLSHMVSMSPPFLFNLGWTVVVFLCVGSLQAAKEALNTKAEEVGSMKRENIDMSEEIEILAESHK